MKIKYIVFTIVLIGLAVVLESSVYRSKQFNAFLERSIHNPPKPILVQTVGMHEHEQMTAIDLGAGVGNEVKYLLSQNWHVTAVEKESKAIKILAQRDDILNRDQLRIISSDISSLDTSALGTFDLVIGYHSLPFMGKDLLPNWPRITSLVRPKGYISVTLFGPQLDWPRMHHIKTFTEDEVHQMFDTFELVYFNEVIEDSEFDGQPITSHTYEIIARKK